MTQTRPVVPSDRKVDDFWQRCVGAGLDSSLEYSWRGMYRSDPARAEASLAAEIEMPAAEFVSQIRAARGVPDSSAARAEARFQRQVERFKR